MRYQLTGNAIEKSLKTIAARDRNVRRALEIVGYPEARRRPEGFETLLRIIVGQQVSVSAANAIFGRLLDSIGPDISTSRVLRLRESTLRKAGLSKAKCRYSRELARMIRDGELDVATLRELPDAEALDQIQMVPGSAVGARKFTLCSVLVVRIYGLGEMWVQCVGCRKS